MPEDCSRFEELEMRELSVEASRETETVPDFTCRSDFFWVDTYRIKSLWFRSNPETVTSVQILENLDESRK